MTAPVVALVGRPNVGKSTLFNQLTRSRDALVADQPGLTRDRQYGVADLEVGSCIVVDTGGLIEGADGLDAEIFRQTEHAISEADLVYFMVDARAGVTSADQAVASQLRPFSARVVLVVNKSEGLNLAQAAADFYSLGYGDPLMIAAAHAQGIQQIRELCVERLELAPPATYQDAESERAIRLAIIGRPNVGKSTLINRLVGEERVIASAVAGTTRDSVDVPFSHRGQQYTLIDTAGVRRRTKVHETIEKFSIIKTLQAIERANAVVVVIDAQQGIGTQDARILGMAADSGRALVIAVNKWDGLEGHERSRVKSELERKLPFLDFAPLLSISALHGSGLGELMNAVRKVHRSAFAELSTSALTAALEKAVASHQPAAVAGRRIKLRYAHQGGRNPPTIVIHGNQTAKLTINYKRYLVNEFRRAFKLHGTPIVLQFKTGENPYKDNKNELSERQQRKRQRMIRHVKRK